MAEDDVATRAAKRERFAQRRKALGLTQEDLAGLLGVDRSTVVRWERGETDPLPWMWPKLARTLQVSAERVGELLAGATRPDGAGAWDVPRQLPAAVADFTGRTAEIGALTLLLDNAAGGAPGTVVIWAIGGTAGVGKTALALHWAHQVAHRFPDGQLYVNLRGFDPSDAVVAPDEAIRVFLDALGVAPDRVPAGLDARAGLYRGLLWDRRMLIVLDNARDEQQVRPLLPAAPGCLVIVTSRSQLAGLAAAEGARMLPLDVLPLAEARQMLAARLGTGRAAAESRAVGEIASQCGRLPLALAVAAARAAARPCLSLTALAAELRDAARRLDVLDTGDPLVSMRTVFSWSVRQLSPSAARLFRMLGLHPGPDISVPAAASLAAVPPAQAGRDLAELAGAHLVTEHVPGRYSVHDLLHAYAAEQARMVETGSERDAATRRLLDHYLHTARAAAALLSPGTPPPAPPQPVPVVQFTAPRQAWAWFEAEHRVLFAAVTLASETGFDACAWQLPSAMTTFLNWSGRWHEWAAAQRTAIEAATRLDDKTGQARATFSLGLVRVRLADYARGRADLAKSLELYEQLGDLPGQARVHQSLCHIAALDGRSDEALGHAAQALMLSGATADRAVRAKTLNNLGWCHVELGDCRRALSFCRQAIALYRELGYPSGEAAAWDSCGYAEHHLGRYAEAAECYQRALRLLRDVGNEPVEALALVRLGDTQHAAGDADTARETWRQALAILEGLHHPDTGKVRVKLGMRPTRG